MLKTLIFLAVALTPAGIILFYSAQILGQLAGMLSALPR